MHAALQLKLTREFLDLLQIAFEIHRVLTHFGGRQDFRPFGLNLLLEILVFGRKLQRFGPVLQRGRRLAAPIQRVAEVIKDHAIAQKIHRALEKTPRIARFRA